MRTDQITVVLKGGGTIQFYASEFQIDWDEDNGKPVGFNYSSPGDNRISLLYLDPDEIVAVTTE